MIGCFLIGRSFHTRRVVILHFLREEENCQAFGGKWGGFVPLHHWLPEWPLLRRQEPACYRCGRPLLRVGGRIAIALK
jgi:hypothetical protein